MKNGGLITKTINTPTTSSASGVWSLQEQYEAETNDAWPKAVAPSISDPYFSNVELLLQFDEANNSTTFTDNSNTNATITASGDTKHSTTVAGRFSGSSCYLDGNGDRLLVVDSGYASLTSDFTIELWVYPSRITADECLFGTVAQNHQIMRFLGNANPKKIVVYNNAYMFNNIVPSVWPTVNSWNHYALTRDSGVCRFFINGVLVGTNSSFSNTVNYQYIGAGYSGSYNPFQGYLDEVRITNGVARYTSTFTPPTAGFPTQ